MSDKLNHMICPTCGHDFYTNCAYATCDACQRMFYASESRTCNTSGLLPLTTDYRGSFERRPK